MQLPDSPPVIPASPDLVRSAAAAEFRDDITLTQWTLVLAAGRGGRPDDEALERLCRLYWPAIFGHVRRLGHSQHEAEDLTQEFFARLLSDDSLARVAPEKGRFRTWLLASLRHFLISEWRRATARKRGGGHTILSLDAAEPWQREAWEPRDEETPDRLYERRWAQTVLARALARLRTEYAAIGSQKRFESLKSYLIPGNESTRYVDTAAALGMSESAVRSAIFTLRRRYGEVLRTEVARTVADPADVDDELRYLLAALRTR